MKHDVNNRFKKSYLKNDDRVQNDEVAGVRQTISFVAQHWMTKCANRFSYFGVIAKKEQINKYDKENFQLTCLSSSIRQ